MSRDTEDSSFWRWGISVKCYSFRMARLFVKVWHRSSRLAQQPDSLVSVGQHSCVTKELRSWWSRDFGFTVTKNEFFQTGSKVFWEVTLAQILRFTFGINRWGLSYTSHFKFPFQTQISFVRLSCNQRVVAFGTDTPGGAFIYIFDIFAFSPVSEVQVNQLNYVFHTYSTYFTLT